MTGAEHLCHARSVLLDGDGDERGRLAAAADDLACAIGRGPRWSPDLREQADGLRARLFAAGTAAETVARMDDETVRSVSNDLWRFSEVAEPCEWGEPPAG